MGQMAHTIMTLAQSQGFEPWAGYQPAHDFQSCGVCLAL